MYREAFEPVRHLDKSGVLVRVLPNENIDDSRYLGP